MSEVLAPWTTATVESLTRRQVVERFLRDTGLGDYGTATGGNASTIQDTTSLQSTEFPKNYWRGAWARISYDAGDGAAAPEGQIRSVSSYEQETGKLLVSTPFGAAVANGDKYELWRQVRPQLVLDFIDQVLQHDVYLPAWGICTEIPDGDMEQSGTDDWTATNATVTKVSAEPALRGKRWLSVATTSAGGSAKSETCRVIPGRQYHLSAIARANASGVTATMTAYDETNSAAIASATSVLRAPVRLWFTFTAPSDCYELTVRFSNVENSVTSYWDDASLFAVGTRDIALPWWVRNEDQVKGVFRLRPETVGTNQWTPGVRGELDTNRWTYLDDAFGRGQLRLHARQGTIQDPLYVFGTRNETAFANDNTDAKHVDANLMQAALAFRVFRSLKNHPNSGVMDTSWFNEEWAMALAEWKDHSRRQAARLEKSLQGESPDGFFYRNDDIGTRRGVR